jgi:serine/threonine-protein kinase
MDKDSRTTPVLPAAGPDPAGADLTGRTLADFHVLRRLGQGGMGQVYLAEQVSLKRKVALKILRADLAADATALARFKHEAEAVARATHANIVQVYAIGEADGFSYMALEYVEGRNLREYLAKKGPPDLLLALSIMRQVASALLRAAELGIIHRDVKPENILLTRKGEVKVADFGLARCLAGDQPGLNLTQTGVTMGTPLYMSPEQVEGKPVDSRTDIYSFGVTCYHMLAGHPPYHGESAFEIALQHVRGEAPPLAAVRPDLPAALAAIVHKMMARDPAQRYQTGRELLKDVAHLRDTLSGITLAAPRDGSVELLSVGPSADLLPTSLTLPTVAATPAATPPPGPRPRQGRRWLGVCFGLTLTGALAAGAVFGWSRRPQAAADPAPNATTTEEPEALVTNEDNAYLLEKLLEKELEPGRKDRKVSNGLRDALRLGLIYLDQDRLGCAERLFTRLENVGEVEEYRVLGKLGRAIVFALRHQPDKSNKLLRDLVPPAVPGDPVTPLRQVMRNPNAPQGNRDLQEMWKNPQLRFWVSQAVRYNTLNKLPDDEVPRLFLRQRDPRSSGGPR